jgi:hypothetical protein
LEPTEFEVVLAEATQGRRVTFSAQPHGMAQILALLPAAEAQTVWLAIDKLARSNPDRGLSVVSTRNREQQSGVKVSRDQSKELGVEADYNEVLRSSEDATHNLHQEPLDSLPEFMHSRLEPLTLDQLRADALSAIAEQFLEKTANENLAHGRPVTLNLTLDLPTFLGLNEKPGILAGYGEIPASTARLLATDAKWRRFITEPLTGNLLDYGRTTYEPPQALVDFIVARDRRCRFPGCRQPARVCDIDHAIPWEEGGETSKENLGLLCRRHHRMKTHGGWKLISFENGSCEWISPEGKRFLVEARPIDEVA